MGNEVPTVGEPAAASSPFNIHEGRAASFPRPLGWFLEFVASVETETSPSVIHAGKTADLPLPRPLPRPLMLLLVGDFFPCFLGHQGQGLRTTVASIRRGCCRIMQQYALEVKFIRFGPQKLHILRVNLIIRTRQTSARLCRQVRGGVRPKIDVLFRLRLMSRS